MANLRPLQPAPMEDQAPQAQPALPLALKPKRTVTLGACVACRKRKSKCDGNRPICSCCAQKETPCVYELGPNEKPSQAIKRKNEEMQGELSDLRQLYHVLHLRPEREALDILHRIRADSSNASPSQRIRDLADYVRRGQPPHESPTQPSQPGNSLTLPPLRLALDSPSSDPNTLPLTSMLPLGYDEPTRQRRRYAADADVSSSSDTCPPPTSVESFLHPLTQGTSDSRLGAIQNWTMVTKDSHFLTLLMTLWHKWEYCYYHYLDWDIFLDDLSSGRTDFCSELLVNALLATASFHSSLVQNRSTPFGDSIITRFYREARRLWEAEEGKDSLTRVQAALCLFLVFGKHGRDKVGYMFLQEACELSNRLGLFRLSPSSMLRPPHVRTEVWDRARSVTAWALFNFQLTMSFTYSLPVLLDSPPPIAIPYDENLESEALFREECARSVVLLECLNTLIDSDGPISALSPEAIEVLYLRLKLWFDHRTASLNPTQHPSPENILTAMQYHVSVIRLFQPFVNDESLEKDIETYRDLAASRTSTAIKELRQLVFLHEAQHGWAVTMTIVLHPLVVTFFGCLDELALQENPTYLQDSNEAYHGLLSCLRAVGIISTYNFYAQSLFRLLAQSCQGLDIPLPTDVTSVLDHFQSEEWTKHAARMVSSQYIADMRRTTTGLENARMDTIISRWGAMTLEDQDQ